MKLNPFLSKKELALEISIVPLLIFKIGLILSILIQVYAYFRDSSLIYGNQSLFPPQIADLYLTSGVLALSQNVGPQILIVIFGLAILTLFKRPQRFSFGLLALLEILLNQRNFIFSNRGDYSLVYFCLMAALVPTVTFNNRKQKIRIAEMFPLFLLHSIIYFLNFVFKISSAWGRGDGLKFTLNHVELLRWPVKLDSSQMLFLNYSAILTIMFAGFSAFISVRLSRTRTFMSVLTIGYHLVANLLMRLSWLSMPFLFLEIAMFCFRSTEIKPGKGTPGIFHWTQKIAIALLLIGFFGIKDVGDLSVFDGRQNIFLGHNWYMFSPPPPMSGEWRALIKSWDKNRPIYMAELRQKLGFFLFQHEYKYFFNLRRTELLPVVGRLGQKLCEIYKVENPKEIQLIYSGRLFEKSESFEMKYQAVDCTARSL